MLATRSPRRERSPLSRPYTPIWWLSVLFGLLSALINLPIVEAPVARPVAQPA